MRSSWAVLTLTAALTGGCSLLLDAGTTGDGDPDPPAGVDAGREPPAADGAPMEPLVVVLAGQADVSVTVRVDYGAQSAECNGIGTSCGYPAEPGDFVELTALDATLFSNWVIVADQDCGNAYPTTEPVLTFSAGTRCSITALFDNDNDDDESP